jgi:hypothetical protein
MKFNTGKLDVLLTVHHGTLINQHQLDTLFLVCLLIVNASTCFGRLLPIFGRLCTNAIWWSCVRRLCVDCMLVASRDTVSCNCVRRMRVDCMHVAHWEFYRRLPRYHNCGHTRANKQRHYMDTLRVLMCEFVIPVTRCKREESCGSV